MNDINNSRAYQMNYSLLASDTIYMDVWTSILRASNVYLAETHIKHWGILSQRLIDWVNGMKDTLLVYLLLTYIPIRSLMDTGTLVGHLTSMLIYAV
jgi:hypothetical protein